MGFWDALDQPVQAQAAQVIGDASRRELARFKPEQWSKVLAEMAVSECALDENKQQQDMQQPLHPRVGEAQCCRALSIDHDSPLQVLERCFADEAVVADALDVEQTPVGSKADLAQFREIFDAPADIEVAGVVDGRLSSKRLSLLMILLDAGFLVIDVQRRNYAIGDDAGAKPAGRAPGDLSV